MTRQAGSYEVGVTGLSFCNNLMPACRHRAVSRHNLTAESIDASHDWVTGWVTNGKKDPFMLVELQSADSSVKYTICCLSKIDPKDENNWRSRDFSSRVSSPISNLVPPVVLR
jgi:hypothetical protein